MECNNQQGFKSEGPASATLRFCAIFFQQSPAHAPFCERCWAADVRHSPYGTERVDWMVAALCDLTNWGWYSLWLSALKGRFPLSRRNVEAQADDPNFEHKMYKWLGFFAISLGSEGSFLYVCLGSHAFVSCLYDERERLSETLRIEDRSTPSISLFFAMATYSMPVENGGGSTTYHM